MTFKLTTESLDLSSDLFAALDFSWRENDQGRTGMYRLAYTEDEERAIDVFREQAQRLGMSSYQDAAGNMFFVMQGQDQSKGAILTGSHVDSIRYGGRYDGPAGVVAGFAVADSLHRQGIVPPQPFAVVIWRCEESPAFNQVSVGAKLAVGELDLKVLDKPHSETGRSLSSHMEDLGIDPGHLSAVFREKGHLLPVDDIAALVELHIEQGPALYKGQKPVGVVDAIRGNIRYPKIKFTGNAGHSGTVPFDQRRDAAIAMAQLINMTYKLVEKLNETGKDAVMTVPYSKAGSEDTPTTIANYAECRLEFRSTDPAVLELLQERIRAVSSHIGRLHQVGVNVGPDVYSAPASLSTDMVKALQESAEDQQVETMQMPSGAGHDAAPISNAGVPAAMLFVRQKSGVSHRPDEDMGIDEENVFAADGDFAQAVRVLGGFVVQGFGTEKPAPAAFEKGLLDRGARLEPKV